MNQPRLCSYCKKENINSQGWSCSDYYGITGYFCSDCFSMIARDGYGKPTNPEKLSWFILSYNTQKII